MGSAEKSGLQLPNPYLADLKDDNFYHFGITNKSHDLPALFRDVKFVCLGGSSARMEQFAHMIGRDLGVIKGEERLRNLSETDRFVLYKAGPVLSLNHGMGNPSVSIALNEILKILYFAGSSDVTFIRIGTCGGVDIQPGSVVVTNIALNAKLEEEHEIVVLGKTVRRRTVIDQSLAEEMCALGEEGYITTLGTTYCTDDFYEGQARIHSAVCEFTEEEETSFIDMLRQRGVKNIEMESAGFVSLCNRAGVKCVVVCVTMIDRCEVETVHESADTCSNWHLRPLRLVCNFLRKRLGH